MAANIQRRFASSIIQIPPRSKPIQAGKYGTAVLATNAIWILLHQAKRLLVIVIWQDISGMAVITSDPPVADMRQTYPPRSAVISWIFFDWAAQPYFTLITTFVFAPYFATHVASDPASGPALWGF